MPITLPSPLTASRDTFIPILQLAISLTTLLLSSLLLLIESRLSPRRPRLLADGEAARLPTTLPTTTTTATDTTNQTDQSTTTTPTPSPQQPQPSSRLPRRARACLATLRLLLAISIAASLTFPALHAIRYFAAAPLSSLASDQTNRWTHALVSRSILKYALDASDDDQTSLPAQVRRVGVGDHANYPDGDPVGKLQWGILLTLVVVLSVIGILVAAVAEKLPMKKSVAALIFAQALVWLVGTVAVTLIRPTKLPIDAAPLLRHWNDRIYSVEPEFINETRFVANWFVALPDDEDPRKDNIVPLSDYPGFAGALCTQFGELFPKTGAEVVKEPDDSGGTEAPPTTALITSTTTQQTEPADTAPTTVPPTTTESSQSEERPPSDEETSADDPPTTNPPSSTLGGRPTRPTSRSAVIRQDEGESTDESQDTPNPDSITMDPLSKDQASELLLVYVVGKPIGESDQYRILSYMALGAIVGAPVAVGQMCRSWFLYPFVALWAAVWFLFFLLATPSVLRVLTQPVEKAQVLSMCGVDYSVLVVDETTRLVARLDVSFFAVVLLIALLQGYRWLRLAERSAEQADEKEVKLVNYEEVYNGSGSLRW